MFEALERAVDELDIPVDLAAVAAAVAVRDRLDAKINAAVAAVDDARLFELDATTSTAAWLRTHCATTHAAAQRMAATAKLLAGLPATRAAWQEGRLSGGQIDVIVAHLGRHHHRFAEHEAALVDVLAPLGIDDTLAAMRAWRANADAVDEGPEPADLPSTLQVSRTLAGRGELRGTLAAHLAEVVVAALRAAEVADPDRTPAERRADALGEVCHQFLNGHGAAYSHRHRRHRPHVNIVVQLEHLAGHAGAYLDGPPASPVDVGVLLCDAAVHRVVVEGRSAIVDYGRATCTIPVDLANALVLRDHHCRWPGCDRPAHWCDGHHLQPWEHGGPTSLTNLALLCRRHHRTVHSTGWHAKLLPDATLHVTAPDGTVRTTAPPGPIPAQFW